MKIGFCVNQKLEALGKCSIKDALQDLKILVYYNFGLIFIDLAIISIGYDNTVLTKVTAEIWTQQHHFPKILHIQCHVDVDVQDLTLSFGIIMYLYRGILGWNILLSLCII